MLSGDRYHADFVSRFSHTCLVCLACHMQLEAAKLGLRRVLVPPVDGLDNIRRDPRLAGLEVRRHHLVTT